MKSRTAVIMCAKDSELFIREAIESILNQTYADFEFIIVENCSTDKTWQIINSYKDSRIKAFKTEISQPSFNSNYGLLQTQAEFIARMDSDDIAMPDRLERQLRYLEVHPEVSVLGTAIERFQDGKPSSIVKLPLTNNEIRTKLPFVFSICHPSVVFRRSVVIEKGGYAGGKCNLDFELWLKLLKYKDVEFANLPEPLLRYRVHPSQIKGSRESYAAAAGVLLREALLQKSPWLFMASVFACLKIFEATK
jgi:glycosyltransferase involved in cell wall biosynthesis